MRRNQKKSISPSHFQIGDEVEVCRFKGAEWYKAEVTGHNFVNGELARYKIKYKTLMRGGKSNAPKIVLVPVRNTRAVPSFNPQVKRGRKGGCNKFSDSESKKPKKEIIIIDESESESANDKECDEQHEEVPLSELEVCCQNQHPNANPDPNPNPNPNPSPKPNPNPNHDPVRNHILGPSPSLIPNPNANPNPNPNPKCCLNPNPDPNECGLMKCTQSPSNSSHAKIKLPFKMVDNSAWAHVLAYDIFKLIPQEPHFNNILSIHEEIRDGIALGLFVSYANLATFVESLTTDADVAIFHDKLASCDSLERDGFNVNPIREYLNKILRQKYQVVEYRSKVKELENELLEKKEEDACVGASLGEVNREIDKLRDEMRRLEDKLKALIDKRDDLSNRAICNRQNMLLLESKIGELKECMIQKHVFPKPYWIK